MNIQSVMNIHWKDWCWSWSSSTLAMWCEEPTNFKRPWCWGRLKAIEEGGGRGWDGWMTSLTQWTWVFIISGSWWWTRKPGMLQSMVSPKDGNHWGTELNKTELTWRKKNIQLQSALSHSHRKREMPTSSPLKLSCPTWGGGEKHLWSSQSRGKGSLEQRCARSTKDYVPSPTLSPHH